MGFIISFFTNLALWKPHNHAYYNISIFPLLVKKFLLCTLLEQRLRTKSVNEILRNTLYIKNLIKDTIAAKILFKSVLSF